jgi:hypothetical protein
MLRVMPLAHVGDYKTMVGHEDGNQHLEIEKGWFERRPSPD